jgi:hypothetical protein
MRGSKPLFSPVTYIYVTLRSFDKSYVHTYHVQGCGDMDKDIAPVTTTEDARAFIEELARRKGTFTDEFKQEAKDEAKSGRKGMLQAIEGSEEIREDLVKALKM